MSVLITHLHVGNKLKGFALGIFHQDDLLSYELSDVLYDDEEVAAVCEILRGIQERVKKGYLLMSKI